MTTNSSNQEKVKSKKERPGREESPTGASRVVRPFALFLFTFALLLLVWPATGQGQSQSRRDRSRRDFQTGPDSVRPGSGRPDLSKSQGARPATSQPAGRITGSAEPNAAPKSADRRSSKPVEKPQVPSAGQDEQWAKYNIILQRNMFSRQRVPIRLAETRKETARPMPNPESYFLLRGITYEDHPAGSNQFVAFVEDKQTGSVLRLHQGDRVARGTIKSLNLDGLEYQLADKTTPVSMGFDLEGRHGAVTADDLASYTPTAAPAAGQPAGVPAAPAANEEEILKRLMEQRKQQLGQ